jgi:branched-chain amino acid aminotransferase
LDDVILPGITRQSAVELARMHESGTYALSGIKEKLVVSERIVNMKEVAAAAAQGTLVEIFGTGKASAYSLNHTPYISFRNCRCYQYR